MKNIEKEFVPYTEALELKQLGFDEPCFFVFDNCSTPMRCSDLRTNQQKFNGVNYNSSSYTSQPTFSQAFRWLREKHGYCSYIKEATKGTYRFYIEKFDEKFFNSSPYKIYEEAELACLRKMIEIVKQKQQ